ncbi:hypothetical protein ES707_14958 [subsurface metagenome]
MPVMVPSHGSYADDRLDVLSVFAFGIGCRYGVAGVSGSGIDRFRGAPLPVTGFMAVGHNVGAGVSSYRREPASPFGDDSVAGARHGSPGESGGLPPRLSQPAAGDQDPPVGNGGKYRFVPVRENSISCMGCCTTRSQPARVSACSISSGL